MLDKDPSRLTTFPVPGTNEIRENGVLQPIERPKVTSKEYWMPDANCKVCFNCGRSFSFFRRRHHCRLCGQIFCHECSDYSLDGFDYGYDGIIRVCAFCQDLYKRQSMEYTDKKRDLEREMHGNRALITGDYMLNTNSIDYSHEQFKSHGINVNQGLDGELINGQRIYSSSALNIYPSQSEFIPLHEQNMNIPTMNQENIQDYSYSPAFSPSPGNISRETSGSPATKMKRMKNNSKRRRSSVELLKAIESSGLLERIDGISRVFPEEQNGEIPVLDATALADIADVRLRSNSAHTQHEIVMEKYMQHALSIIRSNILDLVNVNKETLKALLVEAKEMFDLNSLATSMEEIAFLASGHLLFSMNFRNARGFNYNDLVHVKTIQTDANKSSNAYQFQWMAGVVCRKNISHKQMVRQVLNPRILLLACGITYDRSFESSRLLSFDGLMEQEKSYMSILVEKIARMEPDIVFVGRTVSRLAQELLHEKGVVIVLNVKLKVLERMSRYTGAVVVTSVDHIDLANPSRVIGTCRSFYVKSVPIPPLDRVNTSASSSRFRNESYIFLDGCDPLNGCTITLTGQSKPVLRFLKRIMQKVMNFTYHTLLESHVLADIGIEPANRCFSVHESSEMLDTKFNTSTNQLKSHDAIASTLNDNSILLCTSYTARISTHSSLDTQNRYQQCTTAMQTAISLGSFDDITLGDYITRELYALQDKCHSKNCSFTRVDHIKCFSSYIGEIIISFEELPEKSSFPLNVMQDNHSIKKQMTTVPKQEEPIILGSSESPACPPILYWRWCKKCQHTISPFIPMRKYIYKYSFARFIEMVLGENIHDSKHPQKLHRFSTTSCSHSYLEYHVLFFAIGHWVVRMDLNRLSVLKLCNDKWYLSSFPVLSSLGDITLHNNCEHLENGKTSETNALTGDNRVDLGNNGLEICKKKEIEKVLHIMLVSSKRLVISMVLRRRHQLINLLEEVTHNLNGKLQEIQKLSVSIMENNFQLGRLILMETECLLHQVQRDKVCYQNQMDQLTFYTPTVQCLSQCNCMQKKLYVMSCIWIESQYKLLKVIHDLLPQTKSLSPRSEFSTSSLAFAFGGFSFSTSRISSPATSPRSNRSNSTQASNSKKATSLPEHFDVKELDKELRESMVELEKDSEQEKTNNLISNTGQSPRAVRPHSIPIYQAQNVAEAPLRKIKTSFSSHSPGTASPRALSLAIENLLAYLGRKTPTQGYLLSLPSELIAGHPSLPSPKALESSYHVRQPISASLKSSPVDVTILVHPLQPISCVAFALSSAMYEECLDERKISIYHDISSKAAANVVQVTPLNMTISATRNTGEHNGANITTNWSRAALTSTHKKAFKHKVIDSPKHLSLSANSSDANAGQWEFHTKAYYPLQFHVLRELLYGNLSDYLLSISNVKPYEARGGKSGASFFRTLDDRFLIKHISSTELQSFLEVLPEYFTYMSSVYFDGKQSILAKTVGLYQTTIVRKDTGARNVYQIAVMENLFYENPVEQIYDLKGSSRNRYISFNITGNKDKDKQLQSPSVSVKKTFPKINTLTTVLLDGNFIEFSTGRPLPIEKNDYDMIFNSLQNDTTFLSLNHIVDYSVVIGFSCDHRKYVGQLEEKNFQHTEDREFTHITLGIIDYLRKYDFLKRVESVSKSVGMIAGQPSPTIIEPSQYSKRLNDAMVRYFMPVSHISIE